MEMAVRRLDPGMKEPEAVPVDLAVEAAAEPAAVELAEAKPAEVKPAEVRLVAAKPVEAAALSQAAMPGLRGPQNREDFKYNK